MNIPTYSEYIAKLNEREKYEYEKRTSKCLKHAREILNEFSNISKEGYKTPR